MESIAERVYKVISEMPRCAGVDLSSEDSLKKAGVDSLDQIDLELRLEEEFKDELPDGEIPDGVCQEWTCLQDVIDYVTQRLEE